MNKQLKEKLSATVGFELINKGFYISLNTNKYILFHRKNELYIEIIQIQKPTTETYINVLASIVFLTTTKEKSNICYPIFEKCNFNNLNDVSVDDCFVKYVLKGHYGNDFHYGDVYLSFGNGLLGVSPNNDKKPFGIKIKRYNDKTYDQVCKLILKKINKIYTWLEIQKITIGNKRICTK